MQLYTALKAAGDTVQKNAFTSSVMMTWQVIPR